MTFNRDATGGLSGEIIQGSDLEQIGLWSGSGTPPLAGSNDVAGGGWYIDTDTMKLYQNLGTKASPSWSEKSNLPDQGRPTFSKGIFGDKAIPSNSTTYVDTTLKWTVKNNEWWNFKLMLLADPSATAGLKINWSGTPVDTYSWQVRLLNATNHNYVVDTELVLGGAGQAQMHIIEGFMKTDAAGDIKLQMAQNVATVESKNLLTGSYMWLTRPS